MEFLGSKQLETERLVLRPTEESDLKTLWEILLIPEVNKYYLSSKICTDWEKEKVYQYKKLANAKNPDVFMWSIILKSTNECIGQISVQDGATEDKSIRDIGWFLNPKYQRQGISTEAASKVLDYMFNEVEIKKIITSSAIINTASWGLMEKLGFKRTGERKLNEYYYVEEPLESYVYEINSFDKTFQREMKNSDNK